MHLEARTVALSSTILLPRAYRPQHALWKAPSQPLRVEAPKHGRMGTQGHGLAPMAKQGARGSLSSVLSPLPSHLSPP